MEMPFLMTDLTNFMREKVCMCLVWKDFSAGGSCGPGPRRKQGDSRSVNLLSISAPTGPKWTTINVLAAFTV